MRWHAIGPLQRNKVRYVARWAHAFHALDRLEVAEALSTRRLAEERPPIDCYVQVNVAGEETKAGVDAAAVGEILDGFAALPGVQVVGLMTMPPLASSPEDSRRWFRALAELASEHGLEALSMGTTADYEVAVEEGATAGADRRWPVRQLLTVRRRFRRRRIDRRVGHRVWACAGSWGDRGGWAGPSVAGPCRGSGPSQRSS